MEEDGPQVPDSKEERRHFLKFMVALNQCVDDMPLHESLALWESEQAKYGPEKAAAFQVAKARRQRQLADSAASSVNGSEARASPAQTPKAAKKPTKAPASGASAGSRTDTTSKRAVQVKRERSASPSATPTNTGRRQRPVREIKAPTPVYVPADIELRVEADRRAKHSESEEQKAASSAAKSRKRKARPGTQRRGRSEEGEVVEVSAPARRVPAKRKRKKNPRYAATHEEEDDSSFRDLLAGHNREEEKRRREDRAKAREEMLNRLRERMQLELSSSTSAPSRALQGRPSDSSAAATTSARAVVKKAEPNARKGGRKSSSASSKRATAAPSRLLQGAGYVNSLMRSAPTNHLGGVLEVVPHLVPDLAKRPLPSLSEVKSLLRARSESQASVKLPDKHYLYPVAKLSMQIGTGEILSYRDGVWFNVERFARRDANIVNVLALVQGAWFRIEIEPACISHATFSASANCLTFSIAPSPQPRMFRESLAIPRGGWSNEGGPLVQQPAIWTPVRAFPRNLVSEHDSAKTVHVASLVPSDKKATAVAQVQIFFGDYKVPQSVIEGDI